MKKEIYKRTDELNYTPLPSAGGWDCLSNIEWIIRHLILKYPDTNFELNKKEFIGFMSVFNNEILVSIFLSKRLFEKKGWGMNRILKEGFEFRGIKIRVNDEYPQPPKPDILKEISLIKDKQEELQIMVKEHLKEKLKKTFLGF